jgi:hypothetical protein
MGEHSNQNAVTILLAVYQVERQEEHHSGTSALTLVTVGVAYITAATALAYQCRAGQACNDDGVINLALLLLPLAPVALLGFLALNLATSTLRGRYLVALERELSKYGLKTDDGLEVPSLIRLVRSQYALSGRNLANMFVMLISYSAMGVIVLLFIMGTTLAASRDAPRWIAMAIYLSIVLCEFYIVIRELRTDRQQPVAETLAQKGEVIR